MLMYLAAHCYYAPILFSLPPLPLEYHHSLLGLHLHVPVPGLVIIGDKGKDNTSNNSVLKDPQCQIILLHIHWVLSRLQWLRRVAAGNWNMCGLGEFLERESNALIDDNDNELFQQC